MKYLGISIGVVVFAHALLIAAATVENGNQKMKIGLMTAGLPWHFGPYQSQMHHLSLLLSDFKDDDEIEYDIYWLNYAEPFIPKGVYFSYEELRQHIQTSVPPPAGFPIDHLTFLGQTMNKQQMSTASFNQIQKEYDLDCLVTLMDITKVVPNAALNMPVVAWIPLHAERVSPTMPDYWILRNYHGVAGLAPSSAKAIDDAVGKEIELPGLGENSATAQTLKNVFGSTQVDFIPHIFDRKAISASADVGLYMLKHHSAAEADAKLINSPLINRGQESTLEAGHPGSLFGKERKGDFVVLLQGGNYDSQDRKGWDTSLQAFVRFYNSLDDPSGVHLLIHSMESYLIAADVNLDKDAPGFVMPKGVTLPLALHEHGLPRDAYTIDIAKHAPEVVAAYKKRADVCLHPSKVEGFGMNVIECQVVGTPVITTNYTAMGDFTKLGRSVPYRQTIRNPQFIYDMALPDVIGIADALGEIYEEHLAMKRGEKDVLALRESEELRFNDWIDETCSPDVVGDKFKALLLRANSEFKKRQMAKKKFFSGNPPTAGAYEIASGYYSPIVDWDAPWTLLTRDGLKIVDPQLLHRIAWTMFFQDNEILVMVIPAKYEDGTNVPFRNSAGDGFHDDLPVLVRSVVITSMQRQMSRRKSLVDSAFKNSGEPKLMREGLAIIERSKDSDTSSSWKSRNNEL
jgi:glycosyltransferase involved in cell wall biosynthesis